MIAVIDNERPEHRWQSVPAQFAQAIEQYADERVRKLHEHIASKLEHTAHYAEQNNEPVSARVLREQAKALREGKL